MSDSLDQDGLQQLINSLTPFEDDSKVRLLRTVIIFFGLETKLRSGPAEIRPSGAFSSSASRSSINTFSDKENISPKEFLLTKEPRTDVERVACLAYYLTHFRDIPFFKTLDISKINTEAAQAKFSNAAFSVGNAVQAGYLTAATKGNRQISAVGEQFVIALPDREQAKMALEKFKKKRSRRPLKSDEKSR